MACVGSVQGVLMIHVTPRTHEVGSKKNVFVEEDKALSRHIYMDM